jgi:hypothetical protein
MRSTLLLAGSTGAMEGEHQDGRKANVPQVHDDRELRGRDPQA